MILNITTTQSPATNLGYLLGKHPERFQTKELSFGLAHVFFPTASAERCTASLLLDIDSTQEMRQVRRDQHGRNANVQAGLDQYVSDRPYVASSFFASAIAKVFGTALNGTCKALPELPEQKLPLELEVAAVSLNGPSDLLNRLFEPLGYTVSCQGVPLDEAFPQWGKSKYYHLQLQGEQRLQHALQHLYILLPILDNQKHYFVKESEVEKLLAKADSWLGDHPEKYLIIKRYLKYSNSYQQAALKALDTNEAALSPTKQPANPPTLQPTTPSLHQQRHEAVLAALRERQVNSVLDLGCSSGKFLEVLLGEAAFTRITGVDVSAQALQRAGQKIGLYRRNEKLDNDRINLLQAALTYRNDKFEGYDAAVLIEVIEHLEEERLPALEKVVFKYAQPRLVIVTTPNVEYNACYEQLTAGTFRHKDHRFEWDRATFQQWAEKVATTHGYTFRTQALGEEHPELGGPSQMAIFERTNNH